MSQDHISHAKRGIGSVFPEKVYDSAPGLERVEPLLTANLFKRRFFLGIPLISPLTKEKITDKDLRDFIKRAASLCEVDSKLDFTQVRLLSLI